MDPKILADLEWRRGATSLFQAVQWAAIGVALTFDGNQGRPLSDHRPSKVARKRTG